MCRYRRDRRVLSVGKHPYDDLNESVKNPSKAGAEMQSPIKMHSKGASPSREFMKYLE